MANPELKFQNPNPKNVQEITDAEFYIWLKPICTFEKYANVALKIRHLDPVKGIFVS